MHTIRKIGLAVFKDKKVLMARSKKNTEIFYFVGGKLEANESEIDCLQREAQEEISSTVTQESIKFLSEFEDVAHGKEGDIKVNIRLYTGELTEEPKPSSEIAEIRYFDSSMEAKHRDTITSKQILPWLKQQGYIN